MNINIIFSKYRHYFYNTPFLSNWFLSFVSTFRTKSYIGVVLIFIFIVLLALKYELQLRLL